MSRRGVGMLLHYFTGTATCLYDIDYDHTTMQYIVREREGRRRAFFVPREDVVDAGLEARMEELVRSSRHSEGMQSWTGVVGQTEAQPVTDSEYRVQLARLASRRPDGVYALEEVQEQRFNVSPELLRAAGIRDGESACWMLADLIEEWAASEPGRRILRHQGRRVHCNIGGRRHELAAWPADDEGREDWLHSRHAGAQLFTPDAAEREFLHIARGEVTGWVSDDGITAMQRASLQLRVMRHPTTGESIRRQGYTLCTLPGPRSFADQYNQFISRQRSNNRPVPTAGIPQASLTEMLTQGIRSHFTPPPPAQRNPWLTTVRVEDMDDDVYGLAGIKEPTTPQAAPPEPVAGRREIYLED